jgi:hypothetical protein
MVESHATSNFSGTDQPEGVGLRVHRRDKALAQPEAINRTPRSPEIPVADRTSAVTCQLLNRGGRARNPADRL